MAEFVDQLNRKIILDQPTSRIISLVPSQTELLFDLGLEQEVVGITKFCVHPEKWHKTKIKVGGTKKIDFEKISALSPDIIIGNKEENEQTQVELLMRKYTVWMSDIVNLKQALDMITRIGSLLSREQQAQTIKLETEYLFNQFATNKLPDLKTCAYLIWRKPYMAAGVNTFINDMLKRCNLINVFNEEPYLRYPKIDRELLAQKNPNVILLSSEPYPFKEAHISELKTICPHAEILLVDGEMFSWYGSRMRHAPEYFKKITTRLI